MFHIKIQNSEGNISIIDAFVEKEDNFYEIYIGDTHNGTRINTCIHITVIENEEEAILQDLEYRKTCDIYGNLEESYGTHLMLKGALMFIIQKYPFVKKINLSDVAQKKHTRIYLTPKRILLGKKGWYEEYFGAIPTNKTKSLIKNALKSVSLTPEIIERLSQRSWGNEKDLQTLTNEAVKLIHSDWIITRETIESYAIQIQIQTLTKTQPKTIGGGLRNTRAIFNRKKKAYQDAELKALCIKERVRLESRGGF